MAWVRDSLLWWLPRRIESFTKVNIKAERSSPTDVTVCNFADKGSFYWVVSILLCRAPWTVVAFTWEIGLVVSLVSISQWVGSLILSSAMVLALQYQGCSSRWLLCEGREGVLILRPRNHGEVTGFAFLSSSYCVDMTHGIKCERRKKEIVQKKENIFICLAELNKAFLFLMPLQLGHKNP